MENGKFNNFQVGFLAVITFLNEQFGNKGAQAFKDLLATLNNSGSIEAIRGWMDGNYP